jgi:hypothetical protein
MLSAMVVMGHEYCFHERGKLLVDYLRKECHMRYVADVDAGSRSPSDLQTVIGFHALRAARQPFLLAYLGHGWDDGWYYGKVHRREWMMLTYGWIAELLGKREGPTLILNDTCRSGSLADRLSADPSLDACVISATTQKGVAVGDLTPDVIASWRRGDVYNPRRRRYLKRAWWERRSGVAHDRFFFARDAGLDLSR